MGATIWYECIGPCTYRVYHNSYYDCDGSDATVPVVNNPASAPPDPSSGTFSVLGYDNTGGVACNQPQANGPWTFVSYLEITPLCPFSSSQPVTACGGGPSFLIGAAEAIFYRDYDFCSTTCDYVEILWENCCRNAAISSIPNSVNSDISVSTRIELSATSCNSSPAFNVPPQVYLCNLSNNFLDLSAVDPDGDSLVYSLSTCYATVNNPVVYNSAFSPTQPLGLNWAVAIDAQTGLISIDFLQGSGFVVAPICVLVEEYRNGVKIGEILQDIEVVTYDCSLFLNQAPILDTVVSVSGLSWAANPGDTLVVCMGDLLEVDFSFSDPNLSDNVSVRIQADQLNGHSFNASVGNPAIGQLSWSPNVGDLGATYRFFLIAEDDHCPFNSSVAKQFYVRVEAFCLSGDVTPSTCTSATGAIDLQLWGGTPPVSYIWSNGATTEDISNLVPGIYSVSIIDANGMTDTATFLVPATDLLLQVNQYAPNCDSSNGALAVHVFGGTSPYNFQWSTGANSDSISNLAPAGYSLIVTDAGGCINQWLDLLPFPDSCFVSISGTLFHDSNGNCVQNANEPGIPNRLIDLSPGPILFTDAQGNFSTQVGTGQLDIEAILGNNLLPSCPGSNAITINPTTLGTTINGINLAVLIQSPQDLEIALSSSPAVPGTHHITYIDVNNVGSASIPQVNLQVQFDPQETYVSSQVAASSVDTVNSIVNWSLGLVPPGGSYQFQLITLVDTLQSIDSSFQVIGIVNPTAGDNTPSNNVDTLIEQYVGSYDPNDKQVSPEGLGPLGLILRNQDQMKYTIRFQNTGTYPATYVQIRDTLDSKLDALGFQAIGASHPYNLIIEEDSIMVFTFANINLPDSASDPIGSQGFVSFFMPHRGTLNVGEKIQNQAAIYFDFNPPIFTNVVSNTIFNYPKVSIDPLTFDYLCFPYDLTAQLNAFGMSPYDYQWSTGVQGQSALGPFSTPIDSSGWYVLRVSDAFGLQTIDSVYWEVEYTPSAQIDLSRNGDTIQLAALSENSTHFLWDFGDGSPQDSTQNPTHIYALPGFYTITLIVSNGCGSDTVTLFDPLSLTIDEAFAKSIFVSPNPFSSQTRLSFENNQAKAFGLNIYDLQGKKVREYPRSRDDHFVIERAALSQGIYIYYLFDDNSTHIGKLMIQ